MQIQENISLRPYNTFGIDVSARYFASFRSIADLQELLRIGLSGSQKLPIIILGGGSNILFIRDFDGIVLKNELLGIEKVKEDDEHVYLRVGAGENWHRFVLYCIENNYAGIENLSLIPGCVGASPMQNIGAYGVEIREVFHELTAYHLKQQNNFTFRLKDCDFGYRDSVFKNKYKDQFAISFVTYRLNKQPKYNTVPIFLLRLRFQLFFLASVTCFFALPPWRRSRNSPQRPVRIGTRMGRNIGT